ncbi:MAG: PAS domain S-box protein [Pyrinomonadaceae bacterium]|nr:PAS domain S-box protein [Pyrinomonadaceae bacterium]
MIKILVIDHAGSSRGIRKALPETGIPGFKISFATSYRDMFEGFRGKAYDVCVIDSASGNGQRLFSESRSLGYAEPVILVTSNDAGEAVNAIRSGVADCLIRDDMTANGIERLICSVVEQAREAHQQNERARRHRALLDSADEIIFTHDLKGNLTSMSSSGEQLIGYAQHEWLSLPVSQIFGPAYREVAQQSIQQTLDERRQSFCKIEIVTKHGQSVLVEASLHLVYQLGTAVEIQWIARDLTATDLSTGAFLGNAHVHETALSLAQSSTV